MRHRDLKPLFKTLLPSLPGFAAHKSLLLKAPINGLLRAVHFDSSAFDKPSFYVETLVMPMCVPQDHLNLTFGHRVRQKGKYDGWSLTMPDLATDLLTDIQAQALLYLARADSFRSAVDVISPFSGNPHAPKAMAFLLARAGEHTQAIALIDDYVPKLRLDSHWENDIFDISTHLRDLLINDPEAADRQLREWEDYTIQKLGLESFR